MRHPGLWPREGGQGGQQEQQWQGGGQGQGGPQPQVGGTHAGSYGTSVSPIMILNKSDVVCH